MGWEFDQFVFGKNEKPSHAKLNNVLYLLEKQRLAVGPWYATISGESVTGSNLSPSSVYIMLQESSDAEIGYYWTSGGSYPLSRKVSVEYRNDGDTEYARWENVTLIWDTDQSKYSAELTTGQLVYSTIGTTTSRNGAGLGSGAGEVNLSGSTATQYEVYPMSSQS